LGNGGSPSRSWFLFPFSSKARASTSAAAATASPARQKRAKAEAAKAKIAFAEQQTLIKKNHGAQVKAIVEAVRHYMVLYKFSSDKI
jgi:hypothetical protein